MSPILCRIESSPAKPVPTPPPLSPWLPQACISRARAPAWSPGVARVTLGLLPRHRLDQRGPGAIISALAASTPGLEWQIGSRGERVTRAGQEIYFEEEQCVSGVRDKRATFMWSTVRVWLAPCALIPVPKTLEQGGGSLWSPQCQSVYLPKSPQIWLD